MDMNYGDDRFDSFVAYQGALIEQFNAMSQRENFISVDACQNAELIQKQLRRAVAVNHGLSRDLPTIPSHIRLRSCWSANRQARTFDSPLSTFTVARCWT